MIKYYEIVEGTEAYGMAYKVFHCMEDWYKGDFEKEFREVIGTFCTKNLVCNTTVLMLSIIPEGTRDQFKKNKYNFKSGYAYQAKKNSELNKKYLELVEKHNLKYYEVFNLTIMFGLGNFASVHPFNKATSFVMESRNLGPEHISKIKNMESLKEISASEFYRMKAAQANEDEVLE